MSTTEVAPTAADTAFNAGARARPPVLFAGFLLAGLLLHRLLPFSILPRGLSVFVGRVLAAVGLGLSIASVRTMGEAGTSVEPDRPTTVLVTSGPYRFTRNPIYVSMALLYSGISLFANAVWPLAILPSALFAITRGMVEQEEQYLERRFGEAYRRYKERVRRWI